VLIDSLDLDLPLPTPLFDFLILVFQYLAVLSDFLV